MKSHSTAEIFRRAAKVGQMLAFIAAVFLAVDAHPHFAQSDNGTGHGDSGIVCDTIAAEEPPSHDHDDTPESHGDCVHHFDPLVRAPVEKTAMRVSLAEMGPYLQPVRQPNLSADPPPPRIPS